MSILERKSKILILGGSGGGGAGTDDQTAAEVSYDDTATQLGETDVQGAIEALENNKQEDLTTAGYAANVGGTFTTVPFAMPALEIDVTRLLNTKTVSADSTLTFSATPAAGQSFGLLISNSDSTFHTITIPSSYSLGLPGARTTFILEAGQTAYVFWKYDGSVYLMSGDPLPLIDEIDIGPDNLVDDTYNGEVLSGRNAGETVAQWDVVRLHTDGEWHLADADAAGEFPADGIAVHSSTDGNPLTVLKRGYARNDDWSWATIGSTGRIYLSTTAGGLTQTPPSGSGECVQPVGFALSADEVFFDFNGVWMEVA